MSAADVQRWQELLRRSGANAGNRLWDARYVFERVPLEGKRVLDIGCGRGWHSLYAACNGASRVIGLEPEAQGSKPGAGTDFERNVAELGLRNVELVRTTLQEFDAGDDRFDVILSYASINHLDEEACIRLHEDEAARSVYRGIFDRLSRLAATDARFVAVDCAPANLFQLIGVRNPLSPSIQWHKHQHPRLWADLLSQSGFREPRIRWRSLNVLRTPGRMLFGNRFAAYCASSSFCLTMRYGGTPAPAGASVDHDVSL